MDLMTAIISCPICKHPDRGEIDHDLEIRSPRSVAKHWHFDVEAMATHKVHKDTLSPIEQFIKDDVKAILQQAEDEDY